MTLDEQITALLQEAKPLRGLPDDEAEARGLPALVGRINALRALQAGHSGAVETVVDVDPLAEAVKAALPKRGPGRPRKVDA